MNYPRVISNVFPRFYPVLPRVGEADVKFSEDESPVERPFFGDLIVFYAFDLGDQFELVSNGVRTNLGISEEKLHEHAIRNLRELNLDIEAHSIERVVMLTAGGNFEATLLLLPHVWASVAGMVRGDIVASVPARDIVLFTGDAEPENLAELRKLTSRALEKAEKPLSRNFLRKSGESWAPYSGFAA